MDGSYGFRFQFCTPDDCEYEFSNRQEEKLQDVVSEHFDEDWHDSGYGFEVNTCSTYEDPDCYKDEFKKIFVEACKALNMELELNIDEWHSYQTDNEGCWNSDDKMYKNLVNNKFEQHKQKLINFKEAG